MGWSLLVYAEKLPTAWTMSPPSHLRVPVGGHRAGSAEGASGSRVTATGGGLAELPARETASASAMPAFMTPALGRVRVRVALALDSEDLVLVNAIPGVATALVPLPPWTTTTPMSPRIVEWIPALAEVTATDPAMLVPEARPPVLTSTLSVTEVPEARLAIEQVIFPGPAAEQTVPEAAIPL